MHITFVTETISRTDEGHPRPKYIFNKCGTLQRFGPSQSPNFKRDIYKLHIAITPRIVLIFLSVTWKI